MALPILDGNQSATTLSTILSSGQHIPAHTVVSLGTQAITDMRGAVSGSVVSISNFPATQPVSIASVTVGNTVTIAGTVTANPTGTQTIAGTVTANAGGDFANSIENVNDVGNVSRKIAVQLYDDNGGAVGVPNNPLPISGSVTIGSALPAGTNRIGVVTIGAGSVTIGAGTAEIGTVKPAKNQSGNAQFLSVDDGSGKLFTSTLLTAGTAQIGSVTASISGTVPVSISSVTVGNSVTIGSLPAISGTVTANLAISSTPITKGSFTSLASATLVPANTSRKMATVYNLGAGQLFVNAGATATTLGGGFMVALSSGDFYECDYTTTTLSAIFATAGTASWVSH